MERIRMFLDWLGIASLFPASDAQGRSSHSSVPEGTVTADLLVSLDFLLGVQELVLNTASPFNCFLTVPS